MPSEGRGHVAHPLFLFVPPARETEKAMTIRTQHAVAYGAASVVIAAEAGAQPSAEVAPARECHCSSPTA